MPLESKPSNQAVIEYGRFELVTKDFRISSEYDVDARLVYKEEWNDDPFVMNHVKPFTQMASTDTSSTYSNYKITKIQIDVTSDSTSQNIVVQIPYEYKLEHTPAQYAVIAQYNNSLKQWEALPTTALPEKRILEARTNHIGTFSVFYNHYWYASFTQKMADEFPNWTRIRKTRESQGQQFMNFFGMELQEIEEYLQWIANQKYLPTTDTGVLDWVYLYEVPDIKTDDTIEVFDEGTPVPLIHHMKDFIYNASQEGGILDYQQHRLYTIKEYNNLTITINGEDFHSIEKRPHHIWNTLDEFGLMLDTPRLHVEENEAYKERLLDVFRYPSNSSDEGLTNGIAKELNVITRNSKKESGEVKPLIWKQDTKPFLLKNESGVYIDPRSIRVDGKRLAPDQYQIDHTNSIWIYPLHEYKTHQVSVIRGIEKYQMYDKTDENLHRMMYKEDGMATSRLLSWVEYINTVAPIMWNHFNWDEGFWDTIDKDLTGLGYVPNMWDSDISIWKDYTFNSKIWEG